MTLFYNKENQPIDISFLDNTPSSTKKGSSLYDWDKNTTNVETKENKISLDEVKLMLATPLTQPQSQLEVQRNYYEMFLDHLTEMKVDPALLSHAKTNYKVMLDCCSLRYNHFNLEDVLLKNDFITSVLDKLLELGSFERKKGLLRRFYIFYFDHLGHSILDPLRNSVLTNIRLFIRPSEGTFNATKILHPELLSFLNHLSEKGFKWHKRARVQINKFLKWLLNEGKVKTADYLKIDVKDINLPLLLDYRKHLEQRIYKGELKTSSAQTHIQTLKRWFSYLYKSKFILENPTRSLKNLRVKKPQTKDLLTVKDAEAFMKSVITHSSQPLKELSLFALIATTGIRAQEALSLKRSSINLKLGEMKVLRKNSKEQILPIPSVALLLLELHMKSLPLEKESLWETIHGKPLRYDRLRIHFHKYMKLAGIVQYQGALHSLRRLLLTEVCIQMGENLDLEAVKNLAGHEQKCHLNPYIKNKDIEVHSTVRKKLKTIGGDLCDANQ